MATEEQLNQPGTEAPATLGISTTPDPAAIAVAVEQAKGSPEIETGLLNYFGRQSQLADAHEDYLRAQTTHARLQMENLHEQRHLTVSHMKWQHLTDMLRGVLYMALALIGVGVVFAGVAAIWSAAHYRGVVIDAFQVPDEMVQRGLTGQVIAQQMLDQLSRIQGAVSSASTRPADSYSSNWGSELKVEIPETGVSFGELNRYLREALGHETHVSGEIYATSTGITVTTRSSEEPGLSFSGPADNIQQLVTHAAEAVYAQTQPYRFAYYLYLVGRWDEAEPIMEQLTRDPSPLERAWTHTLNGMVAVRLRGDYATGTRETRLALDEVPNFLRAVQVLAATESVLGHDARAVEFANICLAATPEHRATIAEAWRESSMVACGHIKALAEGDYSEVARSGIVRGTRNSERANRFMVAKGLLLSHDLDGALSVDLNVSPQEAVGFPTPESRAVFAAQREATAAFAALERGDPRSVELWASAAAYEDQHATPGSRDYMLRNSGPWLAYAKARFGDLRGGQTLIAQTPLDCRICVRLRGRIAALAGSTADAEKWFAQAIELAPKLPQAYVDRGQARLDRGDVARAAADAALAAKLSPRNGDAWKLWGDVLAKQGQAKDALAKYDEATKYAPKWQALKTARAAVLGTKN